MKKKIVVVFICILITSTITLPVSALTDTPGITTTSYDVDVPVWEKGDEWTYHFTDTSTGIVTYSFFADITFEVVEDSGDSYILEGHTKPQGSFIYSGLGLKTSRLTSLDIRLQLRKTDLGLENFMEKIKGIFFIKIGPITLPIPLQVELNLEVEFDPTWIIMPFPLYDGKIGNLNSTEFWHTNMYFHLFWGLIPITGPLNVSWPITTVPYSCSAEKITVDAGTFDVYNVSAEWIEGSKFVSYYSEEIGNVAKEIIYLPKGVGPAEHSIILELKDYI
jgi:hypothetical protein